MVSPADYERILQAAEHIIADNSISNSNLKTHAFEHLSVLDRTDLEAYNKPTWVANIAWIPLDHDLTTRSVFDAMYQTATELCMKRGERYVSAMVCASARIASATPIGSLHDEDLQRPSSREELLAANLAAVAMDWIAYFVWPFISLDFWSYTRSESGWCPYVERANSVAAVESAMSSGDRTPTGRMSPIGLPNVEDGVPVIASPLVQEDYQCICRGQTFSDVLRRDRYRCCLSGLVEYCVAARLLYGNAPRDRRSPLEVSRIVKLAPLKISPGETQAETQSRRKTLQILRHFCELPEDFFDDQTKLEGAANCILLNNQAHLSFHRHEWSLRPMNDDNQYTLVVHYNGYPHGITNKDEPTHIAICDYSEDVDNELAAKVPKRWNWDFTGHSQAGVTLPDRDLLRIHAAVANVKYLSGAAGVFTLLEEPQYRMIGEEEVEIPKPGVSGASFMEWIATITD